MPKIKYINKRFTTASLARIEQVNNIINEYLAQGFSLSLRQAFYQLVSRGIIPNTEKSYSSLGDLVSDARLAGLIDWNAIEDRTRFVRKNSHWESPEQIVAACASQYRIDRWANQTYRPEVLIEKDALVGVIEGVCTELDVPYLSCRGYTSQSEMWRTGQRLKNYKRHGQTPIIFHFGDHDPSGIDMSRDIRERLTLFCGFEIEFRRIALNMDQIKELQPPPNPAKVTDSRFQAYQIEYGDESWELDALEPATIVELVRDSVEGIRDDEQWEASGHRERHEASQLQLVANNWDDVVGGLA